MRRPLLLILAGLALGACAGSGGETTETPAPAAQPSEQAAAAESRSASTPTPAPEPAPATTPMATATQPSAVRPAGFSPAGSSQLALELSAPFEIAGFELHLSFDGASFKAGQPEISDQLQGFLCAANPDIVGGFKYICAKVPARRAEGLLATVPISYSARPPTLEDLHVDKLTLVDVDSEPAPAGVELKLRLIP